MISEKKDFRAVSTQYDQDWINGVGEAEYGALFKFLEGKNIKTIIDLAGGSGKLTRMLKERGYDVFLFDIADNMIDEARRNGVPKEKSLAGDIFAQKFEDAFAFDCVILKSSMHEIPLERAAQLHAIIYGLLNPEGWFLDWDVHVPTEKDAAWLKQWVNLKDKIAGLEDLVNNRYIYTETSIAESLKMSGFKNVAIAHRFAYTVSVSKMSRAYWSDDARKTQQFFKDTQELLGAITDNITAREVAPMDIEIKIPAVFVVGQK